MTIFTKTKLLVAVDKSVTNWSTGSVILGLCFTTLVMWVNNSKT